ncbi:MAG: radical SAM protein [Zestosphaera sp.]
MKAAIVDCLGVGSGGSRVVTRDVIGVGPRLIAGVLEALGVGADLFVCDEVLRGAVDASGYDAILVSGMSSDIDSVVRVASLLRGRTTLIAGGPVSVDWGDLLKVGYDYVVLREAEGTLPGLVELIGGVRDATPDEVPNLAYMEGGKPRVTHTLPWLPSPPLWSYTPSVGLVAAYPYWWGARVYVEVVRGCSNYFRPRLRLADGRKCVDCGSCRSGSLHERVSCPLGIPPGCGYCSVPNLYGPARSRPEDLVVREVRELIKLGVRRVVLSAPDFLDYGRDLLVAPEPLTDPRNPPPNLSAIESLLTRLTSIPEVGSGDAYVMIENIKPNLLTEDVARVLGKHLNGTSVHLGLESGDPRLHVNLGRPSTVNEVCRAVELLVRHGLRPYIYLIHGLPGETGGSARMSLNAVRRFSRMGVEKFTLYRFRPLKGSAFEGFPEGRPAVMTWNKGLYYLVRRLNKLRKAGLIGAVLNVVGVERVRGALIAYTLPHGPVVRVPNADVSDVGRVLKVRVVRVESDRVVTALKLA